MVAQDEAKREFDKDPDELLVLAIEVGHRRDIYR
ncbi:hypothetical protein BKA02_001132 [Microbacterium pseudoresistens]|uniref:Uncharacterized protein n=1 Tax=Microbacterium pseudoresistens TaxID=640634 RepID=A0A7Y9EU92_9MICO|nr:hypothetical protein [Microbacterium pseudoresistens]